MEYVFTDLGFDSDMDISGDLWEIDFTDIESAELSSSSAEDCSKSSSVEDCSKSSSGSNFTALKSIQIAENIYGAFHQRKLSPFQGKMRPSKVEVQNS